MNSVIIIVLLSTTVLLTLLDPTNGQVCLKFFRKDYTYLYTDSFYKVHTLRRSWFDAKARCAMEGASLWYPENEVEADTVIGYWNKTQLRFQSVFIGISDTIVKGVFETIDGRPVMDVYNNWSPGEPNDYAGKEDCVIIRSEGSLNDRDCNEKFPYICKKTLASLEWNSNCNMAYPDYVYNEALGRCYKFHLDPENWADAVTRCSAEQSYLAVINSETEASHLIQLTEKANKDRVRGEYLRGAVHLGFHNRDGEGWKTIKGTSLEDSGYANWSMNEPNGGDDEKCGSMFYNGTLNDINCNIKYFYICEHDISKLDDDVDADVEVCQMSRGDRPDMSD